MCEELTLLARVSETQYVMCCEHGITHIVWEHVTIRLDTYALPDVARTLQEAAQLALQHRIAGRRGISIVCDPYNRFQLWIAGSGLYLPAQTFEQFLDMIQTAGAHPDAVAAEMLRPVSDARQRDDSPYQVPPKLFSAN